MPNKRGRVAKKPRKASKMTLKRTLENAITSNPFLNFFLSKCRVKGNAKLHRFARRAGEQWREMSYKEKSPYYLMADKAKSKSSRKKPKKRRYSESDMGEASASTIKILKKPVSTISSCAETSRVKTEDNGNKNDAVKNAEHDDQGKERKSEDYKTSNKDNNENANDEVKTEGIDAEEHSEKRQKRGSWKRGPGSSTDISSGSTSFHSMKSEESEQKCTKPRKKKTRSSSWTDSFDYMN